MTLLQDVQFQEGDDHATLIHKLRILQDEVVSLSQRLAQIPAVNEGVLTIADVTVGDPAAVPASAISFINVTVNGVPGRLVVVSP